MRRFRLRSRAGLAVMGVLAIVSLRSSLPAVAQMSGGMREMMQRMMPESLPPGIDRKLLPEPESRGAQLLQEYCEQCHNLPGPGMHTAAEWPSVVARMNSRMRMMGRGMMNGGMMGGGMMGGGMMGARAPSTADLDALVAYLQKHAQKPLNTADYPDLDLPAGRAFATTCAQCHALPDPKQHTPAEWPDVVSRMQRNMSVMRKPVPPETEIREIIGFLENHARRHE